MKLTSALIALVTVFGLAACNTMAGLGKDIQQGGEALERSAQ